MCYSKRFLLAKHTPFSHVTKKKQFCRNEKINKCDLSGLTNVFITVSYDRISSSSIHLVILPSPPSLKIILGVAFQPNHVIKIIPISVLQLGEKYLKRTSKFSDCGWCPVDVSGRFYATMSRGTTSVTGDIKVEKSKMKWDPKTLEIRTHSVEKTLEPLVHQVNFVSLGYPAYLDFQWSYFLKYQTMSQHGFLEMAREKHSVQLRRAESVHVSKFFLLDQIGVSSNDEIFRTVLAAA